MPISIPSMTVGLSRFVRLSLLPSIACLSAMFLFGCSDDAANDGPALNGGSAGAAMDGVPPPQPTDTSPSADTPIPPAPTNMLPLDPPTGGAGAEGGSGGSGGSAGEGGTDSPGGGAGSGGETGGEGGALGGDGGSGGEEPGDGFSPCPANEPCAVLPLGDSITEGFGSSGGGYRVQLFKRAVMDGKSITFVGTQMNGPNMVENRTFPRRHEGRGGYMIDPGPGRTGISGDVTNSSIQQFPPNIVLLMIGTNDLNGNFEVDQAPMRLGNLMDDIIELAPDALLVVASIIPIENGNGPKVAPFNGAIPQLVEERAADGKHVIFVDNHAAFTTNQDYASAWMGDTLHPNDPGYAVLGDSFYDAIAEYLLDE